VDANESAAAGAANTAVPGNPAGPGADDALAREIGELEFLVGTACSRAINLLMRSDRDPTELADELAFLGEKATRLAVLLRGRGGDGSASGASTGAGAIDRA
jgi:hypothetical protein